MAPANFATTRWTVVMAARHGSAGEGQAALELLCERYWAPLYGYARRQGHSVEQAQDLTQGFFARFLEKQDVRAADPTRGKFRSFLLASFKHYLSNAGDRERAQKRGGGQPLLSLEFETAEAKYQIEPLDALTPEALFERQWALGLIDRVHASLGDESAQAGKAELFERLRGVVVGERITGGYVQIARELGTTEGAIKVTVHRLRGRFRELLRAEIGATVSDDAEIDGELRHLIAVLSDGDGLPGRLIRLGTP